MALSLYWKSNSSKSGFPVCQSDVCTYALTRVGYVRLSIVIGGVVVCGCLCGSALLVVLFVWAGVTVMLGYPLLLSYRQEQLTGQQHQ